MAPCVLTSNRILCKYPSLLAAATSYSAWYITHRSNCVGRYSVSTQVHSEAFDHALEASFAAAVHRPLFARVYCVHRAEANQRATTLLLHHVLRSTLTGEEVAFEPHGY